MMMITVGGCIKCQIGLMIVVITVGETKVIILLQISNIGELEAIRV